VIRYKLRCFALPFFSLPQQTCRPSKCRISAEFGGPLKHAIETGNFSGISYGGGGNFLIPEREFPVALILALDKVKVRRISTSGFLT